MNLSFTQAVAATLAGFTEPEERDLRSVLGALRRSAQRAIGSRNTSLVESVVDAAYLERCAEQRRLAHEAWLASKGEV